jgi:hypothetical protein
LHLANLWHMNLQHTKHWYYKMKREEKVIVQALLRLRRLEMKRKLKKLAKQWTIENRDIIEIDYLKKDEQEDEDQTKAKKDIEIPKHCTNLEEFFFFGEDIDFMRHYKRTCSNIERAMNKFFQTGSQYVKKSIGQDFDIAITKVKLNKGCTVVYAWWDLPLLIEREEDGPESQAIRNKIEIKLNKAIPYLKGYITREIRLKYAPDIKFLRENLNKDIDEFKRYLDEASKTLDDSLNKDYPGLTEAEVAFFKNKSLNKEELYREAEAMNDKEKREAMFKIIKSTTATNVLDYLKEIATMKDINMYVKEYKKINKLSDKDIEEHVKQINTQKEEEEKNKVNTKEGRKAAKLNEKMMKRMRMDPQEFEKLKTQKFDYNEAYFNFLKNYDKPIPNSGYKQRNLSEAMERAEKLDKRDERVENRVRNIARNSARVIDRSAKDRRKAKSENFWKNLENMY